MALTAEQIKNDLVNQILQSFPTAEVDTGSVLRDVMVDPQSIQMAVLSDEIDYVSYLNTFVQNADNITIEDLDEIGATYNVARGTGNISTGLITFQSVSKPTTNIQIGADDGSGGVSVKTLSTVSGNSYVFTTTETVYLTPDTPYNEEHGCYEVTASIQAATAGSEYNVGIGTIRVLDTGIASVTGVYNYVPTSGGTDIQTQTEYANTIRDTIIGSSKNIESGINSILAKINGVSEVKTIHPNSTEDPTEAGYSISYVKGSKLNIISDYQITYVFTTRTYDLSKKPVNKILSVHAIVNGQEKTLQENVDYYLMSDENSIYNKTIYSTDKIVFTGSESGTPDYNTQVTISFSYNELIETCQEELNEELENYLVLGSLLVAQATPVIIDFNTSIKLKYNYNTESIKTEILTGIANYIEGFKLGEDLTQEGMFTYITNTFSDYISSVSYPFLVFCKNEENKSSTSISLKAGEYATIDQNSINITFE